MKNSEVRRSPVLKKMLKAVGLLGVVGMAGAVVLIAPLAGSGCSSDGGAGGHGGVGGVAGFGGAGGVAGAGGVGGATDAGSDGVVTTASAVDVTIMSFMYMPDQFTVAPGGTVTVHNNDSVPHSLTSESAAGNYTLGAVAGVTFDTGIIPAGASASFTIPATAPSGTMIPFFCKVHTNTMQQGMITVQ